jgi:hypothetical protein
MATVQFPGVVVGGKIDVTGTIDVPDGTKVIVTIPEPTPPGPPPELPEALQSVVGMWADREDMADPVEWVRKMREEAWRRRTSPD